MSRTTRVVLGLLLVSGTALHAQRTSVLAAAVAADSAGVPLKNAEVLIPDLHRRSLANWLGEASIANVPRGVYTVRVRALGYAPIEMAVAFQHDTEPIVLFLHRAAAGLDTVRVTAAAVSPRLEDFERRRAMGQGRFLTEAQLDSSGTEDFESLARMRFPGLYIATLDDGTRFLASTRGSCGAEPTAANGRHPLSGTSCLMQLQACRVPVLLDGVDILTDMDLIATWDLAGVEYYSASQVPAQYRRSGTACGIVLAWSK